MAHVAGDRVRETTTSTGTGNISLGGAETGFRPFSGVAVNNDTVYYAIVHRTAAEWEVGLGTWTTGNVLVRNTVIASSNAGSLVNLSSGTKDVFITSPANFNSPFDITPSQLTADQNDYNPSSLANLWRVSANQLRNITGIAGGTPGRIITIVNSGTTEDSIVVLVNESSSSAAGNRFQLGRDVVLLPGESVSLVYSGADSRWRPLTSAFLVHAIRDSYLPFASTDFLGAAGAATVEACYPWDVALISSGTQSKIASTANHPGILRISSSTTANSGASILTNTSAFLIGGGEITTFVFMLQTLTNTTIRFGYLDTTGSGDAVDGVYFEIPSTGAIVGKTSNNSTRTTSSTIATLSTGVWYRATIRINRAATAADFFVFSEAGDLLGSAQITTNIPTAAGRDTGHGIVATNSGTTAVALMDIDYMSLGSEKLLVR